MSYSQNITALAGMTDRTGEHSSNGRDLGLQVQGDFLKNGEAATSSTIRWAYSTDRASTQRTLTSRKTSSAVYG